METFCEKAPLKFSSRFTIDNLLKKDDKEIDSDKREFISDTFYDNFDFSKSWRQDEFLEKRRLNNINRKSASPPIDFRYQETAYWLHKNPIKRPDSLPLTPSFSAGIYPSSDMDLIPSPSRTVSSWSPSEVYSSEALDRWFYKKSVHSPTFESLPYRRRSPDIRLRSPYGSLDSSLSLSRERDAFPPSLLHKKPKYMSINDEDSDDCNRKGGQVRFSHAQSTELERVFGAQKYISPQERKQLSRSLVLSERQVKTWFQNRRAKWRRVKLEDEMRARMSEKVFDSISR